MCLQNVQQYQNSYFLILESELDLYRGLNNLQDAIAHAAYPVDPTTNKTIYSHQKRLNHNSMRQGARRLRTKAETLSNCRAFDSLLDAIIQITGNIPGLGELYFYDVALRIGANHSLYPDKVYLHCGTLDGARNRGFNHLFESRVVPGNNIPLGKRKLQFIENINQLPNAILGLTSIYHIEAFLCVFKKTDN